MIRLEVSRRDGSARDRHRQPARSRGAAAPTDRGSASTNVRQRAVGASRHGGDPGRTRRPGGGLAWTLDLPGDQSKPSPAPPGVAIVDDEAPARALLREYLAGATDVEMVGECANGFEAVKAVGRAAARPAVPRRPDAEARRFRGARAARTATWPWCFVTAYDQYALRAFEVHAVDYLLKPFSAERLADAHRTGARATGQASRRCRRRRWRRPRARRRATPGAILVRDGAKVHVVAVEKIDYVQAQDDYVAFSRRGPGVSQAADACGSGSTARPGDVRRIHRSYVMNLERLARVELDERENRVAILTDGRRLPVSRTGYARLSSLLAL